VTAVVLGDNCIDRYLPPVGREFVGGQAVNVAIGLAAGGIPTAYAGVVGLDDAGERIVGELKRRGVNVSAVAVAAGSTGVTVIATDAGERRFVAEEYGVSAPYVPSGQALALAAAARLVYAAHVGDLAALAAALPAGVELAVDASEESLDQLPLRDIDVLFVSRPGLSVDQARVVGVSLVGRGVRTAAVTTGASGSVAVAASGWAYHSAPTVGIVDTLGAGDAFAAAFLVARLGGRDLRECLASGTKAAGRAIGHWGALPPR
jgi:fructoselysine 6-kinase